MLTTDQVAARLGVSRRRVQKLIQLGTLTAQRLGRDWFVEESTLAAFAQLDRKPGWKPGRKRGPRQARG